MLPVQLTIKGLYSYQHTQTIDFQALTASGVFGIFGSVGSGKSTILEAISFAIYGETERLNKTDKRGYNMMNLKSDELFVEFVFMAGKEQTLYKFVAQGKRNKKNFEDVKTIDRSAYRQEAGEWLPINLSDAEAIVGLNYVNFRRTVIIPQGKFQEFLQLGDSDRTKMLKEIFNLERFELIGNVTQLETINNNNLSRLQGNLAQLGDVSDEMIESLTQALSEIIAQANVLEQILAQNRIAEAEAKQLKALYAAVQQAESQLLQQQNQREAFAARQEKLIDYERCYLLFHDLLQRIKELVQKIATNEAMLEQKKQHEAQTSQALNHAQREFDALKVQYEQREQLNQQVLELQKIQKVQLLQQERVELQQRIAKGQGFIAQQEQQIAEIQVQLGTLQTQLDNLNQAMPDLQQLAAVSNWFAQQAHLENNKSSLEQEQQASTAKQNELKQRQQALSQAYFAESPLAEPNLQTLLNWAAQQKQEALVTLRALDNEILELLKKTHWKDITDTLSPDHPCPICGSLEHPDPLNVQDVNDQLTEAQAHKRKLEHQIAQADQAILALGKLQTEWHSAEEQAARLTLRWHDALQQVQNHRAQFIWVDYRHADEGYVKQEFERASQLKNNISQTDKQLRELKANFEEGTKNLLKYKEGVNKLEQDIFAKQAEINVLKSQLLLMQYADFEEHVNIDQQILDIQHTYQTITQNYSRAEQALTQLNNQKSSLAGEIMAIKANLEVHQGELKQLKAELNQRLEQNNRADVSSVEQILGLKLNIQQERAAIDAFKQQLAALENHLQELRKQTNGKAYQEAEHQALIDTITDNELQIKAFSQRKGELNHEINRLQSSLRQKKQLEQEMTQLQHRADNLNVLRRLFTGSGFVNYISSVYLQNLCNAANERFYHLTRKTLRLELTENNNFQIRDFLNDGKTRHVKTLSGGQTFQAALSLALALADNIKSLTHASQNFFFLDEGFGSQDKESLQVVFDTLKALRKENRIVGVISHVDDLQQEIDTYLHVKNDPETGSMVRASWLARD